VTAGKVANEIIFVLKNKKIAEISYNSNIFEVRTSKAYFSQVMNFFIFI
jgi:hypothetical protein